MDVNVVNSVLVKAIRGLQEGEIGGLTEGGIVSPQQKYIIIAGGDAQIDYGVKKAKRDKYYIAKQKNGKIVELFKEFPDKKAAVVYIQTKMKGTPYGIVSWDDDDRDDFIDEDLVDPNEEYVIIAGGDAQIDYGVKNAKRDKHYLARQRAGKLVELIKEFPDRKAAIIYVKTKMKGTPVGIIR